MAAAESSTNQNAQDMELELTRLRSEAADMTARLADAETRSDVYQSSRDQTSARLEESERALSELRLQYRQVCDGRGVGLGGKTSMVLRRGEHEAGDEWYRKCAKHLLQGYVYLLVR